jgi:hypothetical protein
MLVSLAICTIFFIIRGDHGSGDGSIHIIYGYNLQTTGRLEFNSSQLSSGTSSPTWTLLIALISSFVDRANMFLATEILSIFLFSFGASCAAYYGLKKHSSMMGWLLPGFYIFINLRAFSLGLQWEDALLSTVLLSTFLMVVFYKNTLTTKRIFAISILAGFTILSRPQEIVPIGLISVYFLFYNIDETKKNLAKLIFGAFGAMFISVIYFIWCRIYTGSFLPFSVAARLELKDSFNAVSLIDWDRLFFQKFLDPVTLIPCIICLVLMFLNKRIDKDFFGYLLLFLVSSSITFYITGGYKFNLYAIANNSIIFIACAEYLIKTTKDVTLKKETLYLFIGAFGLVLALSAVVKPGNGFSWKRIVAAEECNIRNKIALNSVVMLHEVQNRWCLDKTITVIAMNGITDQIMTPTINSPEMIPLLLRKHNVEYVELYQALATRHFPGETILGRAAHEFFIDKGSFYEEQDIVFTLINEVDFNYLPLIKISYK